MDPIHNHQNLTGIGLWFVRRIFIGSNRKSNSVFDFSIQPDTAHAVKYLFFVLLADIRRLINIVGGQTKIIGG